ncbi:MAG: FAD-binding oxidoreductase [Polyangiaceae bacterium]
MSLRNDAPRRILDGFGRAVSGSCRYEKPASIEALVSLVRRAKEEGLTVTFRGCGRSYGDAALNTRGIVIDLSALDRILAWDPNTGRIEAEAGLTIESLWQRTIADGYWPAVVPGTMHATLGGCIAMNVHGKNNPKAGPFGDYVRSLTLLLADGSLVECSRTEHPELFCAVIGGLGLLGAVVRVSLELQRIESGQLRVRAVTAGDLAESLDRFEVLLATSDYVVGWIDAFAKGRSLGRGELHAATHLNLVEDPHGAATLSVAAQNLPATLFGLPREQLWKVMRPFCNPFGMSVINAIKYQLAKLNEPQTYLQSHAAFAFLLDYIPDWRLAYGDGGFIQHQLFVPKQNALGCLEAVLRTCQEHGEVPNLAVLKRHRPDDYLLSHGLDGWSLALDFRVTEQNRRAVWSLSERLTELVLDAQGKFYFAKDAVLRPGDVLRAYGKERVETFLELKRRYDPTGLFGSDLSVRVFSEPTP